MNPSTGVLNSGALARNAPDAAPGTAGTAGSISAFGWFSTKITGPVARHPLRADDLDAAEEHPQRHPEDPTDRACAASAAVYSPPCGRRRTICAHHWTLDPAVVFLNHGSFGACPRAVLAEQDRLRALDRARAGAVLPPRARPLLDAAREDVAAFVGADPDDLVFVRNATAGVNAVLGSLRSHPATSC
jgi:hypothetical protein